MITNILHRFKKVGDSISMLRRDVEYIKKTQIKLLEIKTKVSEMKITPNKMNRWNTAEERWVNLKINKTKH